MVRVERSFENPNAISIDDEIIIIYGWANPNNGNGTHASKGTIFLEKTCGVQSAVFWLKLNDTDPKSWVTWGTGQPRYVKAFGYDGNAVAPKWLETFHSISSNTTPFVIPEDATIRAISVRTNGTSTASFELYKNGATLLDTISLVAVNKATKKNLNYAIVTDDEFSVKVATGSANDISYELFVQVNMVP